MLLSLHIENIAVARRIDIEPGPGFTVLTGETGAGKSVIIGSLRLLCGARPDRDQIRSGESGAMVSGVFGSIGETARRELEKLGINGTVRRRLGPDINASCGQLRHGADRKEDERKTIC